MVRVKYTKTICVTTMALHFQETQRAFLEVPWTAFHVSRALFVRPHAHPQLFALQKKRFFFYTIASHNFN